MVKNVHIRPSCLKVNSIQIAHVEAMLHKPQNRKPGSEWQRMCTVGLPAWRLLPFRFRMWRPNCANRKTGSSEVNWKHNVHMRPVWLKVNSSQVPMLEAMLCRPRKSGNSEVERDLDVHAQVCLNFRKNMWFQLLVPWWRVFLPFHWRSEHQLSWSSENDILEPKCPWRSILEMMPNSSFSLDWGLVLHGGAWWLCGPEHTLATFQLQDFFGKKKSDLSYGAHQWQFFIFLEEGGFFFALKNDFKKKPCP